MTPDHEGSSSPACNSLNDRTSIFKYDEDEGEGEEWAVVNLTQLLEIVDEHFRQPCKLVKLAEGGYHKIYDIHPCHEGTRTLDAVLRVASPAFPSDKMNSEVATLRYIGEHSSVPVPKVYAWNADAGSPAGVEYMIMEKVPGVAPLDIWPDLPVDIKEKVVVQVAEHLVALFHLRFSQAGSIYLSDPASSSSESVLSPTADTYRIGPVITGPFYRALNRILERPDSDLIVPNTPPPYNSLHSLRGPFAHASEYLSSYLRAKLLKLSVCRAETLAALNLDGNDADSEKGELILQRAEKVLKKAIELCHVYPGDVPVPGDISTPDRPFTVKLNDFWLVNILIDEQTGTVNGYIDFEGTTTAPLWLAATIPDWIPDPAGDMASWYGGTPSDQARLRDAFNNTVDRCDAGGEWRRAYEDGQWFRTWAAHLGFGVEIWGGGDGELESWVDERLRWASQPGKKGVGMPEEDF